MVDVRRYFETRLQKYGDSHAALGWSEEGQRRRFEALLGVGELDGHDLLDVGCGLGHLYDFLRSRHRKVRYAGIDLSPRMISKARERHPRTTFLIHDIRSGPLPVTADFVVASGVLNVRDGQNELAMRRLLRSCFDACRIGTAVNMLSAWADYTNPKMHYFEPPRMLRLAKQLTRKVVLRHDYLPHDFTLYLLKDPPS